MFHSILSEPTVYLLVQVLLLAVTFTAWWFLLGPIAIAVTSPAINRPGANDGPYARAEMFHCGQSHLFRADL